jgi:hypothetical protein
VADTAQVSVDRNILNFDEQNWDTPQTVAVMAVDNELLEDARQSIIRHSSTSSDRRFHNVSVESVLVYITDDEQNGTGVNLPVLLR